MRRIREVLRLRWEQALTYEQIASSCNLAGGAVFNCVARAKAAGLTWPLPAALTDPELERALYPPPVKGEVAERAVPDWADVHRELRKKGVTLRLLWLEYQQGQAYTLRYSAYCARYQQWRGTAEPRMHQVHRAGEKLFVDYAGLTVPIVDPNTSEIREAQVFVAALGASSYLYAEATWTQQLPDWIGAHVRALAFFGGVPELVVPDNLKSAVTHADYYDPELNPTYREWARHYGTAVLPARPRKPRDKAKVENGVQQVERWVLAPLRDRTFFTLAAANAAVQEQLQALNERVVSAAPSRRELFEAVERPALRPLPHERYELANWKRLRVPPHYHLRVDEHHYSVPYLLINHEVEARLTARIVEIYHAGSRVASHPRAMRPGGYTTVPEHMPPGHRAYAERDVAQLLTQAQACGPETSECCRQLLAARHPQAGYRACQGLLQLGRRHGLERLERACARAVATGALTYRSVQSILVGRLEDAPLPATAPSSPPVQHANIRGADYFLPEKEASSC